MSITVSNYDPRQMISREKPQISANIAELLAGINEASTVASVEGNHVEAKTQPKEAHEFDGQVDEKGTPFDSDRHLPKLRKTKNFDRIGLWMPKKPKKSDPPRTSADSGQPAVEFTSFTAANPKIEDKQEEPAKPKPLPAGFKKIGDVCAGIFFQVNTVVHGDNAMPKDAAEFKSLAQDFQDVAEYYGDFSSVHPVTKLFIGIGAYELVRFLEPPKEAKLSEKRAALWAVAKKRIGFLGSKVVSFVSGVFGRKKETNEEEEKAA